MSSMLYSKYNIEIWNFHIIAICFYSQFVQCPNFYGIGFVHKWPILNTHSSFPEVKYPFNESVFLNELDHNVLQLEW